VSVGESARAREYIDDKYVVIDLAAARARRLEETTAMLHARDARVAALTLPTPRPLLTSPLAQPFQPLHATEHRVDPQAGESEDGSREWGKRGEGGWGVGEGVDGVFDAREGDSEEGWLSRGGEEGGGGGKVVRKLEALVDLKRELVYVCIHVFYVCVCMHISCTYTHTHKTICIHIHV
jgi:hypothetical protein